jgi:hypothetical protein
MIGQMVIDATDNSQERLDPVEQSSEEVAAAPNRDESHGSDHDKSESRDHSGPNQHFSEDPHQKLGGVGAGSKQVNPFNEAFEPLSD